MIKLTCLHVLADWFYLPGFTFLGSPGQNLERRKMAVVVVAYLLTHSGSNTMVQRLVQRC